MHKANFLKHNSNQRNYCPIYVITFSYVPCTVYSLYVVKYDAWQHYCYWESFIYNTSLSITPPLRTRNIARQPVHITINNINDHLPFCL